jgi:hypothetical protein
MLELICTVLLGSLPPLFLWITDKAPKIIIKPALSNSLMGNSGKKSDPSHFDFNDYRNNPSSPGNLSVPRMPDKPVMAKRLPSYPRSTISSMICNDKWEELKDLTDSQQYKTDRKYLGAQSIRAKPSRSTSFKKRWDEQPDSPTDPNILNKFPGVFTFKFQTHDVEANLPGHTILESDYKNTRESMLY